MTTSDLIAVGSFIVSAIALIFAYVAHRQAKTLTTSQRRLEVLRIFDERIYKHQSMKNQLTELLSLYGKDPKFTEYLGDQNHDNLTDSAKNLIEGSTRIVDACTKTRDLLEKKGIQMGAMRLDDEIAHAQKMLWDTLSTSDALEKTFTSYMVLYESYASKSSHSQMPNKRVKCDAKKRHTPYPNR